MAAKKKTEGITAKEHVMNWFNGVTNPEEAVKWLKERKLALKDGLKSSVLLGMILGALNFVVALISGAAIAESLIIFAIYAIITPLAALIFAAFMKGASALMKGEGTYSEHVGIIGIFFGIITIATLPLAITSLVSDAIMNTSDAAMVISLLLALVGLGVTIALAMMVFMEMCLVLAEKEKMSLMKSALTLGTAVSIAFIVLFAVLIVAAAFLVGTSAFVA